MTCVHYCGAVVCIPRVDYYLARWWRKGYRKAQTKRFRSRARAEAEVLTRLREKENNRGDVLGCETRPSYYDPIQVFRVRVKR